MAEFENGYCTGCGVKARRWGHRPFCWRYMTMKYDLNPTHATRQRLLKEMEKYWRIRSLFLVKREHMYYQSGDPPHPHEVWSANILKTPSPARGQHG